MCSVLKIRDFLFWVYSPFKYEQFDSECNAVLLLALDLPRSYTHALSHRHCPSGQSVFPWLPAQKERPECDTEGKGDGSGLSGRSDKRLGAIRSTFPSRHPSARVTRDTAPILHPSRPLTCSSLTLTLNVYLVCHTHGHI